MAFPILLKWADIALTDHRIYEKKKKTCFTHLTTVFNVIQCAT